MSGPPGHDPERGFEVESFDVVYRGSGDGALLARVYRPRADQQFPGLLDVHGGIWTYLDRTADQALDEDLASSGLVVVAVDFRMAPACTYPASIQDVNYATRWLKAHAQELQMCTDCLGGLGVSSGGHMVILSALRPRDSRYAQLRLMEGPDLNATLAYVVGCWPVTDPYGRYVFASGPTPVESATEDSGPWGPAHVMRQRIVQAQLNYFVDLETMQDASPRLILLRGEAVELPPMQIVHGTADTNVPIEMAEDFAAAYRAAGGSMELELFPGAPHFFGLMDRPDAVRARELIKTFIAQQVARIHR
jgi:acetyl esterase/lipase